MPFLSPAENSGRPLAVTRGEGARVRIRTVLLASLAGVVVCTSAGIASAAAGTQSANKATAAVARGNAVSPPPGVILKGFNYAPNIKFPGTRPQDLTNRKFTANSTIAFNNWAGYADIANSGDQMGFVGADFNVPSVNCAKSPVGSYGAAYEAQWVGLDGITDGTVEQTGVAAYCTSTVGAPSYYAWFEMYPLDPVTFTGVNPGDALSTTVQYFGNNEYHLNLTDITTGATATETDKCPSGSTCENTSAEVVSEDPGGAVPNGVNLADFGMENFTGTRVESTTDLSGSLAESTEWSPVTIDMEDNSGTPMATPSGLYGGRSFNVAWNSAT